MSNHVKARAADSKVGTGLISFATVRRNSCWFPDDHKILAVAHMLTEHNREGETAVQTHMDKHIADIFSTTVVRVTNLG